MAIELTDNLSSLNKVLIFKQVLEHYLQYHSNTTLTTLTEFIDLKIEKLKKKRRKEKIKAEKEKIKGRNKP